LFGIEQNKKRVCCRERIVMICTTVRVSDDPKRRRTTTRGAFDYSLKQISAACLLSGLIAGAITVLTTESSVGNGPNYVVLVNRMNKANRLPLTAGAQLPRDNSTSMPVLRMKRRVPVGCERAFSTVADPVHANVVRRCLT
jgi:hypothetical protein